jgi:hypothetical protein
MPTPESMFDDWWAAAGNEAAPEGEAWARQAWMAACEHAREITRAEAWPFEAKLTNIRGIVLEWLTRGEFTACQDILAVLDSPLDPQIAAAEELIRQAGGSVRHTGVIRLPSRRLHDTEVDAVDFLCGQHDYASEE